MFLNFKKGDEMARSHFQFKKRQKELEKKKKQELKRQRKLEKKNIGSEETAVHVTMEEDKIAEE